MPLCVRACAHTRMYVCAHAHTHVCVHAHVHAYACVCNSEGLPSLSTLMLQIWDTCSAAVGSLSRIAWAALLFLYVRAVAKGVNPLLSRTERSIPGWHNNKVIMAGCWFWIATWSGVFPSASYNSNRFREFFMNIPPSWRKILIWIFDFSLFFLTEA